MLNPVPQVRVPRVEVPRACVPGPQSPCPQTGGPHIPPSSSPGPYQELPRDWVAQDPPPPAPHRDMLEEGTGQRGAVTSRATPSSCDKSLGGTACATNLCGGRALGSRRSPHLLVPTRSHGWRYLETGQRLDVPLRGQGCAQHPSQGHKQLKGLWEHGPGITHRPGSRWRGRDGAGPALESRKDLQANPYGVHCGAGGSEGPSCG